MIQRHLVLLLSALFLLAACGTTGTDGRPNAEERGRLSTKMVNLSSAVDAYFLGLTEPPQESDEVILQKATSHDPRLLAPEFTPYLLKVQYQNPYAVVLLCSQEGKAIMEDAGCSARLDRQVQTDAPCQFTLRVLPGCQVQGADPH
jgi:hypothetical protein